VALGNAGPVGCAGFLRIDKYAEVKRLFVVSSQRRQGIGRALMQELERHALRAGLSTMKLETGAHQKNSQLLYKSMGYKIGSAFGLYKNDPLSVFMTKNL
jgi:putative acetyltransferase